jgi:hypothetical protein
MAPGLAQWHLPHDTCANYHIRKSERFIGW